ncbi:MAG: aminoacyl-tRNA deacylase [Candidatus Methylomirabilales bacterium]
MRNDTAYQPSGHHVSHEPRGDTALNLREWLRTAGVDAQIVAPGAHMPTVEAAAAAMGVAPEQIFKSILFQARDGRCVMAIAAGTARIDRARVEAASGLTGLKLAKPDVVLAKTGYPAGGTPPIGHREVFPVLVDSRVAAQPVGYAGGGRPELLVRIRPADILRLTGAQVHDLTGAPSAECRAGTSREPRSAGCLTPSAE